VEPQRATPGTTDIPLTDNGRRLAEQIRPVLAREAFTLVLVSPMQRARETCALAGLGAAAVTEPDLVEWNYGRYEGLTPKQIHEGAPGWLIFRDGCPDGESLKSEKKERKVKKRKKKKKEEKKEKKKEEKRIKKEERGEERKKKKKEEKEKKFIRSK